jgi:TolB-like protein
VPAIPGPAPTAAAPAEQPAAGPAAPDERSIAVLSFTDLSPNKDQEYFSDGMAEEILDALAKMPGLKVAGRTSSFYFKGKNETVQTIGAALGVAHVLEGSVRKQGDKVRITAQLLQAKDGFHLWSESYDGDLADVFALQERIAHAIAGQLKVVLAAPVAALPQEPTENTEAHQQFLRGRYFLMRRGFLNLRNAEGAFKAAVAADAGYAEAWAGLAQVYALLPEYSAFDPDSKARVDTVPQALDAAARALALDPRSSRALSARAYVKTGTLFDWDGGEADYKAAIASDPRDFTALQWYGEFLTYQRRWDEAQRSFDAAVAAEPLAPIVHFARALCTWWRGDTEGALAGLDEALRIAPELYNVTANYILLLVDMRRFAEARKAAATRTDREYWGAFIDAAESGRDVDRVVARIRGSALKEVTSTPAMLMVLGRREDALAELEQLFAARDPLREYAYAISLYEPLHGDPRYQALLRQIGLPRPAPKQAPAH